MKLSEYFEAYLGYMAQKGMDPKTISEHRRMLYGSLAHSVADREIDSLRIIDVAGVMQAGTQHGKYGPQRSVIAFRRVLKYIKDSGYSIPFDWREVEVPNVPTKQNEYLTKEELEKVLNSFDIATPAGLRTRALTEVLFATGMRISEVISLNKEDIDWEKKEAMVTNAKTKDVEKIYFTSRSLEWLKKYIDSRKDDIPALFVSGRGRMLSVTARNYLRTHTGHLGIKKHIKHHLFRKTFATHLIQGGADIIAVGDLCRHRSPRTTLRFYAAVNKERSKDKHQEILGRVLGGDIKPNKKSLRGELMEFEKWVSMGAEGGEKN